MGVIDPCSSSSEIRNSRKSELLLVKLTPSDEFKKTYDDENPSSLDVNSSNSGANITSSDAESSLNGPTYDKVPGSAVINPNW